MAKGWTAQIYPVDLRFLEKHGAVSQRGKGLATFNRSAVLHRELELLRTILRRCDPVKSGGLPQAIHDLAVRLIPEPWSITKDIEIDHLADYLAHAPDFAAEVAAAGQDPAAALAAVAALGFVEKAALLVHAVEHQAPAAATAARKEP